MSTTAQVPSYKTGLQELQENLRSMLPQEALDVFAADANALEAAHRDILKLAVGDKAPDFSLTNAIGQKITLSQMLKDGRVVITFYRGTWCPYCNLQLNQYQSILPEIQRAGAQLVAISPQTPDESLNFKEKNELEFEVLSDNGNLVASKFTTVFKNDDEPVGAMKNLGIDFHSHYSDDSGEIPVPAVFMIDIDRTITFAKAMGGDYRNRVEPSEIIEQLRK